MSAQSAQKPGQAEKRKASGGAGRPKGEIARASGPVLLAAIAIAFAVVNLKQVKVDWIVGSGHAPLIVVIVISLLVGIVLTHFAERMSRSRRRG
jgi:uncharacterized integral membrane protein